MASDSYPSLFSPCAIGKRIAPNRFVSQPMECNDSLGGKVSERTIARYEALAAGGWGIIIIEALAIAYDCLARKNQMVLNTENLESFQRLVTAMRRVNPETIILMQIAHSGRKSGKEFSRPTALYAPKEGEHLLTGDEIEAIRKGFVEAVMLAEQAGADGVDFKLCHGYLGCEMLRPANNREDQWGGSFENRTRFLTKSIEEVRARLVSSEFILGSRVSYYEGIRGGCGTGGADELTEDLRGMDDLIKLMRDLGMDYVNVSAGIPGVTSEITRPTGNSKWFYLHQFRYARQVKTLAGDMKVIGSAYTVLQKESLALAEENLQKGFVDFAGWGRQVLADPAFPQKILENNPVDYCIMCSGCSRLMVKQQPVECIVYRK
jgi:2,4-dienoyl-CoA reductase-like NADH-dependent reductase (Old Yellow Enzyme family)